MESRNNRHSNSCNSGSSNKLYRLDRFDTKNAFRRTCAFLVRGTSHTGNCYRYYNNEDIADGLEDYYILVTGDVSCPDEQQGQSLLNMLRMVEACRLLL